MISIPGCPDTNGLTYWTHEKERIICSPLRTCSTFGFFPFNFKMAFGSVCAKTHRAKTTAKRQREQKRESVQMEILYLYKIHS